MIEETKRLVQGWIRNRNSPTIDEIWQSYRETVEGSQPYLNKTPEEAKAMFEREPQVQLPRQNGWLTREEKWKIAFYCQKLPPLTERKNCVMHHYYIAAKFAVSLSTVNNHRSYCGW